MFRQPDLCALLSGLAVLVPLHCAALYSFCMLALSKPLLKRLCWQLSVASAQLSAAQLASSLEMRPVSWLLCRYLSGSPLIQDSIQSLGVGPDMQLSDMPEHGEQTVRAGCCAEGCPAVTPRLWQEATRSSSSTAAGIV